MRYTQLLVVLCVPPLGCHACSRNVSTGTSESAATTAGAGGTGGGTQVIADCAKDWCRIPSGVYIIGSPPEEWGHPAFAENQVKVTLTRPFLLKQTEVTQNEWASLGYPNPSGMKGDGSGDCGAPDCPVGNVTWFEAAAYANALSKKLGVDECYLLEGCTGTPGTGMACTSAKLAAPSLYECKGYRLPTEAEWEYAARAGTASAFYSGDIKVYPVQAECNPDPNLEKIAWYCHNSARLTHSVGMKQPNGWGLLDMAGNAYEWMNDDKKPDGYGGAPLIDPFGQLGTNPWRVLRGGAMISWATLCRSAAHFTVTWDARDHGIGFRLARTIFE
jgi:formylglycine-generating enzyme